MVNYVITDINYDLIFGILVGMYVVIKTVNFVRLAFRKAVPK